MQSRPSVPASSRRPGILRWLLLAAVAACLTACSSRYVITTTSGTKVIAGSKPKRVESRYVYRGIGGESNSISVLRVRSIEPYSKSAAGKQPYRPEIQ